MFALFAVLLVGLAGCTWFAAKDPSVALGVSPAEQVVDIADAVGYAVAAWRVVGDETVVVDFGDGESIEIVARERGTPVSHQYDLVDTYTVSFSTDDAIVVTEVVVEADPPIVNKPFWEEGELVDGGQRIDFNVSYRAVGCVALVGGPSYITGIRAGDGITEFRMMAWLSNETLIGVFDLTRPRGDQGVWGEWQALGPEGDLQILTVIAGYTGEEPDYPAGPFACPAPDPIWEPPIVTGSTEMHFSIEARNQYLKEEDYPHVEWTIRYWGGCQ